MRGDSFVAGVSNIHETRMGFMVAICGQSHSSYCRPPQYSVLQRTLALHWSLRHMALAIVCAGPPDVRMGGKVSCVANKSESTVVRAFGIFNTFGNNE